VVRIASYDWLIGLGLAFGLAFSLTYMISKKLEVFLVFLMIFTGFVVAVGLLPVWSMVIQIIFLITLVYVSMKKRG
jgi:hypothetical protein